MYAKYQVSIYTGSKVMTNVKVADKQTDKQTNGQTDKQTDRQGKNNMPPDYRQWGHKKPVYIFSHIYGSAL